MLSSNESENDHDFEKEHSYKVNHICEGELQCVFEPWDIENWKQLKN